MFVLIQNTRYALRLLCKSPGYTLAVVLVLGVGIGANTALFSIIDSVLLRPPPYPQPDKLMMLLERDHDQVPGTASLPNYLDWRTNQRSFTDLALVRSERFNLSAPGQIPERAPGATITANYLDILGVQPVLGRNLTEAEDTPGGPAVVMVSDSLWRERFGARPEVIGAQIILDGVSREIVGVLPPTVDFPRHASVFVPLGNLRSDPAYLNREEHNGFKTLGRLKPGVSLVQAKEDLNNIAADLERRYPADDTGRGVEICPLLEYTVGACRHNLYMLLAAAGCIMLIACTNVANLQLASAATRRKELAVRAAMGASRKRLVWQMLTESAVLGLLGGVAGVMIAVWILDGVIALGFVRTSSFQEVHLNFPAMVFAAVVALGSGLLAGIWPAWKVTGNLGVASTLQESTARGSSGDIGQGRVRRALVVMQIALAVVMLAGAGLLLRSFWCARNEPLGFRPDGVLTAWFSLPRARYDSLEKQAVFLSRLVAGVRAIPEVLAAAVSTDAPFSGNEAYGSFHVTGTPPASPGEEPFAYRNCVSPGYFQAMGIPLLRGRDFTTQDGLQQTMSVIIDDSFVRRHFGGQEPLGQRIDKDPCSGSGPVMTIVGVVPHVHTKAPAVKSETDNMVQLYLCATQAPQLGMTLIARAKSGDPASLVAPIRKVLASLDPELPLSQIRTMDEGVAADFVEQRSTMTLLIGFAGVALLLASIGLYAVVALNVAQRTRELGIRMALGAPRRRVLQMVMRQGAILAGIGLTLGLVGALVSGRLIASTLYGVTAIDPLTLFVVPCVLGLAVLLACCLPAYRATKVDPLIALRNEGTSGFWC
ncbi:MAG: ABC transporter permease [Rhodospirillales bacterium]|nr:ABC transporter permease [Acetobacter sp.]